MDLEHFRRLPILGIVRGVQAGDLARLTETVVDAGLETIEITMNTAGAADLIRQMAALSNGRLTIGAGTVLTIDDLNGALDAGATFIVLPTLVREVVEQCRRDSIPVFPGAFTPQEIHAAWSAGATMVKVFPAKFFGPAYFQEIKGPFADIELLACGGVSAESIEPFFSAGASAVAFGASVFKPEWLAGRQFDRIGAAIRNLIEPYRAMKNPPRDRRAGTLGE